MKILVKMGSALQRAGTALIGRETSIENYRHTSSMSESGQFVTGDTALAISSVWACVNLVAGSIGSLPLTVYRRDSFGNQAPDREHPLYRLLHDSPNYDQTATDFWEFMSASLELWGNAYAHIERTGSKIVGLVPIIPTSVVTRRISTGSIEYRWTADGKTFVRTDQDVLHIRGFGGNPLGGMSTLRFARNSIGLAQAIEQAASATFRHGLRPSGALTFDKWLTQEQRSLAEVHLLDKIGSANSGRPLILEGGTKWEQLTINPEDAQMLQSRSFSVEETCRFFGVPPHMIGHTEKSSSFGTGLEQQTLAFQKFTLRRRLRRIEQALAKQLLTPADRAAGVGIQFNLEGLLRADSRGRAEFYRQMTSIGAMTINEVRRLENLPNVDGGDVPRMQMQNVPITGPDDVSENLAGVPDVQAMALNGAQMQSLQRIVQSVADGQLPPASAIEMMLVSFPTLTEEQARAIIKPTITFTPAPLD